MRAGFGLGLARRRVASPSPNRAPASPCGWRGRPFQTTGAACAAPARCAGSTGGDRSRVTARRARRRKARAA
eukprot:1983031-Prymnesium_polylepis.1